MAEAHTLALEQWQSEYGCHTLNDLWQRDEGKAEAERITGRLVANLPRHRSIIDLGCGSGRLIPTLPEFERYRGFDLSSYQIELAQARFGDDKRCRFEVYDFRQGSRYKQRQDVVVCVHVARHYDDPIGLLRQAMVWPARYYVFSALHAPARRELLNGVCLATAELDAVLGEWPVIEVVEQAIEDGMSVRYWSMEAVP
ncbi:MAG: class I SAM-dependent methyltransferase [Anaerolineae bacterium]|nr:class I SAM-dependent methyltransferase [Anaerolineae bacterium]